jgi:hypothetical protein
MSKQATKAKVVSDPKIVSVPKTRSDFAAEIIAASKQTIEGILKLGHTLIAAKAALDHGQFLEMIEHDLPFTSSTAERLMKIAADSRITNTAHAQLLPFAWGTLYEISKLDDSAFEQALSSGAINPRMTREQARTVRLNVTHETVHTAVPYTVVPSYVRENAEEPATTGVVAQPESLVLPPGFPKPQSILLADIERLIHDLEMAVECGDIKADIVFAGRIRTVANFLTVVADRMLDLINDDDRKSGNRVVN